MSEFGAWDAELYHHGILGMKWGVRRYQNEDGSLTALGLKRRARLERLSYKLQTKNERANIHEEEKRRKMRAASEKKQKLKNLTDQELDAKIARLKKEQQVKDLSSNGLVKLGADLVSKAISAKEDHENRALQKLDLQTKQLQARNQTLQRRYQYKQSKFDVKKAEQEAKKAGQEARLYESKGKIKELKTQYKEKKWAHKKNDTISGAIRSRISKVLVDHADKTMSEVRQRKNINLLKAKLESMNLSKKIKDFEISASEPSKEELSAREKRGRKHS